MKAHSIVLTHIQLKSLYTPSFHSYEKRYQASPALPYCKRQEGEFLGTRLSNLLTVSYRDWEEVKRREGEVKRREERGVKRRRNREWEKVNKGEGEQGRR